METHNLGTQSININIFIQNRSILNKSFIFECVNSKHIKKDLATSKIIYGAVVGSQIDLDEIHENDA